MVNNFLTRLDGAIDRLLGKYQKYHKHVLKYVLGIIALGFIALTVLVMVFPHSFIDLEFSEEVQEHQNPVLDILMKAVSWFGYFPGSAISVVSAVILFLVFKYRREALFVLLTATAGLISTLAKVLVNRPRPTEPLVHIVQKVSQQSFPSGHVLFYIMFFGFLTVLMYDIKTIPHFVRVTVSAISMLLIFTVPFSRIYLGAHWFTDVLGGFLLGMLCLYVFCYFYFAKKTK
jgi:membrane-associated phospholipid phosphatase